MAAPHLSWQSDNTERNWRQAAYEILVASSDESLRAGKADIWDSGKVDSGGVGRNCLSRSGAGIAKEILLESSCVGRSRATLGIGGRSLVGDGTSPCDGLEGKVDSLEEPRG